MATFVGEMIAILNNPVQGGYSFMYGSAPEEVAIVSKTGVRLRDDLLSAKRYHLDSDTTKAAATYAFNVVDPVEEVLRHARAPFDNVWMEWPLAAQHAGVGLTPAIDAPLFAGNFIQRDKSNPNRFWVTSVGITQGETENEVFASPVSVIFDVLEPIGEDEFMEDTKFIHSCLQHLTLLISSNKSDSDNNRVELNKHDDKTCEQVLTATLLGGSEPLADDSNGLGKLLNMATHAKWVLTPYFGERFKKGMALYEDDAKNIHTLRMHVAKRITESSGMFRFCAGALALLNRKQYIKTTAIRPNTLRPDEVGKKAGIRDRTPNYQFVEFAVPHTVFIREVQGEDFEAKERCRHEVAGHYCESHRVGDPDCTHVFTAQSPTREICLLCGSKRWWRKAHERGNANLGFKERASRLLVSNK